jgi:hypothetical protein
MTKNQNELDMTLDVKKDVPEGKELRQYVTPKLEKYGDVRDVTMGGTPGLGDSSPANTQTMT